MLLGSRSSLLPRLQGPPLDEVYAQTSLDAAEGALLGLVCGSAAGALLEDPDDISAQDAHIAMRMPSEGEML